MEKEKKFHTVLHNINIGKIPIMLKSDICVLKQYHHLSPEQTKECKYDPGGYFIINGSEKTVLTQERTAENIIFCFKTPKNTKWSFVREVSGIKFGKTLQVQFQHNDDQIIITAVCQNQYCDSVRHDLLTMTESIKFD